MSDTSKRVLKPGYATDLNGTSREFRNSSGSLAVVFVLALVFVYLELAARFESFVDPLIILFSVPLPKRPAVPAQLIFQLNPPSQTSAGAGRLNK